MNAKGILLDADPSDATLSEEGAGCRMVPRSTVRWDLERRCLARWRRASRTPGGSKDLLMAPRGTYRPSLAPGSRPRHEAKNGPKVA